MPNPRAQEAEQLTCLSPHLCLLRGKELSPFLQASQLRPAEAHLFGGGLPEPGIPLSLLQAKAVARPKLFGAYSEGKGTDIFLNVSHSLGKPGNCELAPIYCGYSERLGHLPGSRIVK